MKKTLPRILFLIFFSLVMIMSVSPVFADDASQLAEEITKTQQELEALENQTASLNNQINELNQRIQENTNTLASNIQEEKKAESTMGKRSRAMYMFGGDGYLQVLFSSENMEDFLSNLEKVTTILKADKTQLDELQATQNQVNNQISSLVKDKITLQTTQEELNSNLEAQKSKLSEEQQQLSAYYGATGGHSTNSSGDRDFICAVVASEANSSYDAALAVISCVMNRCDTGQWGGTDPVSVLTAPGQFAGYLGGSYKRYLNHNYPSYVEQAVSDCLDKGIRNHNFLGFRSKQYAGWSGGPEKEIGGNVYGQPMS